jgi:hypothetical protein
MNLISRSPNLGDPRGGTVIQVWLIQSRIKRALHIAVAWLSPTGEGVAAKMPEGRRILTAGWTCLFQAVQ